MTHLKQILDWYQAHVPNGGQYATINQEPYSPLTIEYDQRTLWVHYETVDWSCDEGVVVYCDERDGHEMRSLTPTGLVKDNKYCEAYLGEINRRLAHVTPQQIEWQCEIDNKVS